MKNTHKKVVMHLPFSYERHQANILSDIGSYRFTQASLAKQRNVVYFASPPLPVAGSSCQPRPSTVPTSTPRHEQPEGHGRMLAVMEPSPVARARAPARAGTLAGNRWKADSELESASRGPRRYSAVAAAHDGTMMPT